MRGNPSSCHNLRESLSPLAQLKRSIPWQLQKISKIHTVLERNTEFPLQFERRPESTAATREEPQVPCLSLRGGPIPLMQLERNPEFPAATREETQLTCCNSRGNPSSTPQLEMRPDSSATTQEETRFLCLNSRGGLTSLFQMTELRFLHHNSRATLRFLMQIKRNPEIPLATREEA